MIKDPYGFWEKQRKLSFPGMSWNSLVGTFTVFVTDAAISRHVFNHNSKVRAA
jgi:cytochrome P450 family 710 subfamily A protein